MPENYTMKTKNIYLYSDYKDASFDIKSKYKNQYKYKKSNNQKDNNSFYNTLIQVYNEIEKNKSE